MKINCVINKAHDILGHWKPKEAWHAGKFKEFLEFRIIYEGFMCVGMDVASCHTISSTINQEILPPSLKVIAWHYGWKGGDMKCDCHIKNLTTATLMGGAQLL